MAKAKKNKFRVSFVGGNAEEVTGSCILVEIENKKILLECGLYQGKNVVEDYRINSRKFKFKPKDIDYVFINHIHADHSGLVPRLVKEGFNGRIITTEKSAKLLPIMLEDSAYIIGMTSEFINKTSKRKVSIIYNKGDVDDTIPLVDGYDMNILYELDENISFEFIPNGHIIGSASLKLYLKNNNSHVETLLYTSDIGNIRIKKPFVEEFRKVTKCNYVISECTYGNSKRQTKKGDFAKDLEKIKAVVSQIVDNGGRIIIPCFSLDRTQFMLKILYDLYGEDENFTIPIVVDSPLSKKVTDVYREILEGEDKELIEKICGWNNVRFITEKDDSKACISDKSSKIVLSASGMLHAGRSRRYVKEYLPNSKDHILFCGYCAEGSLGWKIKNYPEQKTITIDGELYKNRCSIHSLRSFSSHIQYDDLISYLSQINCEKIMLVHGNMNDKIQFARELQEKLRNENKTIRVVAVNKGTSFSK